MFQTSVATSTITSMLDEIGRQSVAATVYTVQTFWGWFILAAVIGFLIFLGKRILHLR